MESTNRQSKLARDEAGAYILDKETKLLMLTALRDGRITENAADIIRAKCGSGRPRICFKSQVPPESSICHNAFEVLEARCNKCSLMSGCVYWEKYGRALTVFQPTGNQEKGEHSEI